MTKPEPNEVLFKIIDGIEYATLHADIFREAMLERDRLRTALMALVDALHEVGPDAATHVGDAEAAAIIVLSKLHTLGVHRPEV